jgi:hypothetical protein
MNPSLLISLKDRAKRVAEAWPHSPHDAVFDLAAEGHFGELFEQVRQGIADDNMPLDDDQLAVSAAMALVAEPHMWPAHSDNLALLQFHIEEVVRLMQSELSDDPARHLRAAEFVIAYLHGWRRESVNWNSADWDGVPKLAKKVLWDFFFASVHSCLSWMESPPAGANAMGIHGPRVIGWSRGMDRGAWVDEVYKRFIGSHGGCICWQHLVVGTGELEPDPASLRGNARTKMLFHLCFHCLRSWSPRMLLPVSKRDQEREWEDMPFWIFCQIACKGFAGEFDTHYGGFPSGILFDCLLTDRNFPLRLVWIARWQCCGQWTACLDVCPACGRPFDPAKHKLDVSARRLILEGPDGAFEAELCWECRECQNYYKKDEHLACPLCGAPHSTGRARPHTVWFYQPIPGAVGQIPGVEARVAAPEPGMVAAPGGQGGTDAVPVALDRVLHDAVERGCREWELTLMELVSDSFENPQRQPQWARLLKDPPESLPAANWAILHEEWGRQSDYPINPGDELEAAWGNIRKEVIGRYQDAFSEGELDLQTELRARFP